MAAAKRAIKVQKEAGTYIAGQRFQQTDSGVVYEITDVIKRKSSTPVIHIKPIPDELTFVIGSKSFTIPKRSFPCTAEHIDKMLVFGRWKKL